MLLFARARDKLPVMPSTAKRARPAPHRAAASAKKAPAKIAAKKPTQQADNPLPFGLDGLPTGADSGLPAGPSSPVDGGAGVRREARALFWMGWKFTHIAERLGVPRTTLIGWSRADGWEEAKPVDRVAGTLESRLVSLIAKDQKTGGDFKEIDLLTRQMERLARIDKYGQTGRESDLNPNIELRNAGPKKKPEKNAITPEQVDVLCKAFLDSLFDYQRTWWGAAMERTRQILKSRQIGATWYFAREALIDALQTGRNQIFLSASKNQAHVFRNYIIAFVKKEIGVALTGDPIILPNGAELIFLGTNSRTAQSYHGNLYFDEYFWTTNFTELNNVASGMSSHKQWRLTYFSTPSSLQHEAYALWNGSHITDRKLDIDLRHEHLANGFRGADGIWRHIVTVEDAERGGCTLFDIENLRSTKAATVFANLYLCQFMDDALAVFPLSLLQRGMVDPWEAWKDFKAFTQRPFGHKGVWVGYDPSHTGDKAALVVLAPPEKPGGKFRVLYRKQMHKMEYEDQAAEIQRICQQFNVEKMTIDTTGMGQGVYQLVRKFFPAVRGLRYSLEAKILLVLKAQTVLRAGRLEFDQDDKEMAASFMSVKQEMTPTGRSITYSSGRSEQTGHGDLAWATMNALSNEPLEQGTEFAGSTLSQSFVEISE